MDDKNNKKELETLKTSYLMYEKSKAEALKKRKSAKDKFGNKIYSEESTVETIELINTMQEDIKEKYIKAGGDVADLVSLIKKKESGSKKKSEDRKKRLMEILSRESGDTEETTDATYDGDTPSETDDVEYVPYTVEPVEPKESPKEEGPKDTSLTKEAGSNKIQYDSIPLPSKGECYKNKKGRINVAYLTAYDENVILSPNLYREGTFIDKMLENKILESDVHPEDLIAGDRDAIILWLRATGYGYEYPVSVTDNETGQKFDAIVDLSKIGFKPFTLKGDKYGNFNFTLPISKDVVTFKFLTAKDERELEKMRRDENKSVRIARLNNLANEMIEIVEEDDTIIENNDLNKKRTLTTAINTVRDTVEEIYSGEDEDVTHELTDRLIRSIVAINKITDANYIENYVYNMNIKDASELRKYIVKNEPGLDYTVEVERPESLGGGSMKTFLSLDEFIFINVI